MGECYHPSVTFSDPVFTDLHGAQARAMWHMLCKRGTDLEVSFDAVHADDTSGSARWQAAYTFGRGRRVHNFVEASFTFEDDKIITHRDDFDLWQWTRMAIGPIGTFAGWSAPVQNKVRRSAAAGLRAFMAGHPEYS